MSIFRRKSGEDASADRPSSSPNPAPPYVSNREPGSVAGQVDPEDLGPRPSAEERAAIEAARDAATNARRAKAAADEAAAGAVRVEPRDDSSVSLPGDRDPFKVGAPVDD